MKWRTVSLSLLLATVLLLLLAAKMALLPFSNARIFSEGFSGKNLQLGYYDLLTSQREIYDTRFRTSGNTTVMTMTSPNDNRFIVKVGMEQRSRGPDDAAFNYHKIYYADGGSARMITNVLGYAQNNGTRFSLFRFSGEQLLITPSGQIFTYHP